MISLLLWVALLVIASFDVIGWIEWVKSVRDAIASARAGTGKKSTVAWPFLSLVFSLGIAVCLGMSPNSEIFGSTLNAILFTFASILPFIEIFGYNVIVRLVFHLVDKAVGSGEVDTSILARLAEPIEVPAGSISDANTDPSEAPDGSGVK
jgi:hypothetical protein